MGRTVKTSAPSLFRRYWPRAGALARTSDRIEKAVLAVLLAVGAALLPVTLAIGSEVYVHGSATAQQQNAEWYQATAVLTADAPSTTMQGRGGIVAETAQVAARWDLPDGTTRTGTVPATNGSRAGTRVPVWLDRAGHIVHKPITEPGAVGAAVVAVIAIWISVIGVLAGLFLAVRFGLNRYRLAAWERAWTQVERDWNHPVG